MISTTVWHVEQHPDLIMELGKVTVRWSALDLLLVQIMSAVLKNHEAAHQLVFAKGAGQQRFRLFERVIGASGLEEVTRKEILGHIADLSELYGKRNALIHEPLETMYEAQGKHIKMSIASVGREGKRRKVDLAEIKRHIAAVDNHLSALEGIATDISHLQEDYVFHDDVSL